MGWRPQCSISKRGPNAGGLGKTRFSDSVSILARDSPNHSYLNCVVSSHSVCCDGGDSELTMGHVCCCAAARFRHRARMGAQGVGGRPGGGTCHGRSLPRSDIWDTFLFGRQKAQRPGHKNGTSWFRCFGGAYLVLRKKRKGPDTHLPLQARLRTSWHNLSTACPPRLPSW